MQPRPITLISLLCSLCILGCASPKSSIDNAAIYVGSQALDSKILAEDISTTTMEPDTASKADKIVAHQDNILETSSGIRTQLHGVEDSTPWWGRLLQQGFVAAAIIGVIILLWQTGIGSLIKKIVWSIGWFIPRSAMRSAEMDL